MSTVTSARNRIEAMHGVNLDVLARRDPDIYGTQSLADLERTIRRWGRDLGLEVRVFQTNYEGEFVEHLHRLPEIADGALINAGAWTHYSWAIHDALEIAQVPVVEVHLSDVDTREEWRRVSVLDGLVIERIAGEGAEGYRRGLEVLKRSLETEAR